MNDPFLHVLSRTCYESILMNQAYGRNFNLSLLGYVYFMITVMLKYFSIYFSYDFMYSWFF